MIGQVRPEGRAPHDALVEVAGLVHRVEVELVTEHRAALLVLPYGEWTVAHRAIAEHELAVDMLQERIVPQKPSPACNRGVKVTVRRIKAEQSLERSEECEAQLLAPTRGPVVVDSFQKVTAVQVDGPLERPRLQPSELLLSVSARRAKGGPELLRIDPRASEKADELALRPDGSLVAPLFECPPQPPKAVAQHLASRAVRPLGPESSGEAVTVKGPSFVQREEGEQMAGRSSGERQPLAVAPDDLESAEQTYMEHERRNRMLVVAPGLESDLSYTATDRASALIRCEPTVPLDGP